MRLEIEADSEWTPTAGEVAGGVVGIGYVCPRCQGVNEIRVQPPATADEPVDTELWCHRCQIGTPARISRD